MATEKLQSRYKHRSGNQKLIIDAVTGLKLQRKLTYKKHFFRLVCVDVRRPQLKKPLNTFAMD